MYGIYERCLFCLGLRHKDLSARHLDETFWLLIALNGIKMNMLFLKIVDYNDLSRVFFSIFVLYYYVTFSLRKIWLNVHLEKDVTTMMIDLTVILTFCKWSGYFLTSNNSKFCFSEKKWSHFDVYLQQTSEAM